MLAQIVGIAGEKPASAFTPSMLRELKLMGITLTDKAVVRSRENIPPIIRQAITASDLVFILLADDPHTDRIVCESICNTLGLVPKLHIPTKENLIAHYKALGKSPSQVQLSRAMLPQGCTPFPNEKGIQPAYALSSKKKLVIVLPGGKKELYPLFLSEILPLLESLSPKPVASHLLSCYGLTAQDAETQLGSLMNSGNPIVTVYSMGSSTAVRVTACAATEKQAKDSALFAVKTVGARLGSAVCTIDAPVGLENALGRAASKKKLSLALVEISPHPLLAARLSHTKSLAPCLKPPFTFSSLAEGGGRLGISSRHLSAHGKESPQAAVTAAQAARKRTGASYCGVMLVPSNLYQDGKIHLAVTDGQTVWCKSCNLNPGMDISYQLDYCAEELLYLFWQVVSAHPDRLAGGQPIAKLLGKPPAERALVPTGRKTASSTAVVPVSRPLPAAKASTAAVAKSPPRPAKPAKKEPLFQRMANAILPQKGDAFIDILRKIVLIVSIIVFTGSVSYLVNNKANTISTRNMYEGLSEQMYDPEVDKDYQIPSDYPKDYQEKFAKLWEQNHDIVGYLNIPGTTVNYPVVQTTEKDSTGENYYHRRDFTKASNAHGTPYADYESDLKKPSTHILIYGHNMTDGLMFGEVDKYKNLSFYQQAPVINFDSVYKNGQYKIFGVFITNSMPEHGEMFNYHQFINAKDKADFDQFVNEVRERSFYDIPVDVKYGDELLSLSTCNYYYNGIRMFEEARLVVVARRVRDKESAEVDVSAVKMNEDAKHPDAWYTVMDQAKQKASEAIDSVTIDGQRELTLEVGGSASLTYTILPDTASNKKVNWTSSNGEVVTVDANGVVQAVGPGTAAITVTTQAGGEQTDTIKVIVTGSAAPDLNDLTLNKNRLNLILGESDSLRAQLSPSDVSTELIWKSSDPDAVEISDFSEGGKRVIVTANDLADGVVITVSTPDGTFFDECIVNVLDEEEAVPVEEVLLDEEEATLSVGSRLRLKAEIYPEDALNQTVYWSSSDKSVATVEDGRVTAIRPGEAIITVTTEDGEYTAECLITVTEAENGQDGDKESAVNGVSLDADSLTLSPGEDAGLQAAVSPPEAEEQRVSWNSSSPDVATVNSSGKVTAVSPGEAVITVTTREGGFTASCTVTVLDEDEENEDNDGTAVEGVLLDADSLELSVGDSSGLTASVFPYQAEDQRVRWESSDASVASVNSDGKVTGESPGEAVITVTTREGGFTASCTVTVTEEE